MAASAEVKAFGQRMVDDQTATHKELMTIAHAKHIPIANQLEQQYRTMADTLAKMHSAAFDRAYMAGQLADHEQAVILFTAEAKEGQDAELKAYAAKTLPALQEHVQLARNITTTQQV